MSADGLAVRRHLEWMRQRGLAESTIYQRHRLLARLAAALPAGLLEASRSDLAAWRASLTTGAEATVHYVLHAREFYAWALAEGLIGENPAARLPLPRPPRLLPRPIAEDDLFRAFAAATGRVRLILALAGWAGLRAREIALLRRQHVLDSARPPGILVDTAAGKGRRERIVPLTAGLAAELAAAGLPRAGYVLPRLDGRPGPVMPWMVSHLANDYLHSLGIGATLHQLRHYYATEIYRESGWDLRAVQEGLGHANVSSTTIYTAYDRSNLQAAAEAMRMPRRLRVVR